MIASVSISEPNFQTLPSIFMNVPFTPTFVLPHQRGRR
jgi:hypothetical protein